MEEPLSKKPKSANDADHSDAAKRLAELEKQLADSKREVEQLKAANATQEEGVVFTISKNKKGNERRVTVKKLKGRVLVDMREFYTDQSGKLKPGRKGICFTKQQFETVVSQLGDITAAIESMDS